MKKSPRLIVKTDKKEKKEWIEAKVASKAGNRNFSCSIVSESDVFNQHTRAYIGFGWDTKKQNQKGKKINIGVWYIKKKIWKGADFFWGKKKEQQSQMVKKANIINVGVFSG